MSNNSRDDVWYSGMGHHSWTAVKNAKATDARGHAGTAFSTSLSNLLQMNSLSNSLTTHFEATVVMGVVLEDSASLEEDSLIRPVQPSLFQCL